VSEATKLHEEKSNVQRTASLSAINDSRGARPMSAIYVSPQSVLEDDERDSGISSSTSNKFQMNDAFTCNEGNSVFVT
jgi:hypothetical protein